MKFSDYILGDSALNEADGLDNNQVKRAEEIKEVIINALMKHPYYKAYQKIEDSNTGPVFWADKKYRIRASRMGEVFYEPWKPDDEPARLGTLMFRCPTSGDKNLNKNFEKFAFDVMKICYNKFGCKMEYPKSCGDSPNGVNYGSSTVIYRFAL